MKTVKLGELMAERTGSIDPSAFPSEVFDLYSIPAFDKGVAALTQGAEIGSSKQVVCPSDVLLSKIVPHIRRAWVVEASRGSRQIASGEWIVFRDARISPAYLRHVLIGDRFHAEFMKTVSGVGGSLLRARPSHVAKIDIPLPPLAEQERIAAVLDAADALRAKRRHALTRLDALARALFLHHFGDPVSNPKGWPVVPLGETFEQSPVFGTMIPAEEGAGPWVCIRVANIKDWELDLTDSKHVEIPASMVHRHTVQDGDILMARAIGSEDHLGKSIIVNSMGAKWAFDSHVMRLRFDQKKVLPAYIRQMFMTEGGRALFLRSTRRTAVQFNINTKEISALKSPLPPLALQRRFADELAVVERMKATQRAHLAKLDTLFAALQSRAFAGEL